MSSGINRPIEKIDKLYDGPAPGPASESGAQVWSCVDCKHERRWGYGQPSDKLEVVWLVCEGRCNEDVPKIAAVHTRHTFVRVKAGW